MQIPLIYKAEPERLLELPETGVSTAWYGIVAWYSMVEVCEGAPVAVSLCLGPRPPG